MDERSARKFTLHWLSVYTIIYIKWTTTCVVAPYINFCSFLSLSPSLDSLFPIRTIRSIVLVVPAIRVPALRRISLFVVGVIVYRTWEHETRTPMLETHQFGRISRKIALFVHHYSPSFSLSLSVCLSPSLRRFGCRERLQNDCRSLSGTAATIATINNRTMTRTTRSECTRINSHTVKY